MRRLVLGGAAAGLLLAAGAFAHSTFEQQAFAQDGLSGRGGGFDRPAGMGPVMSPDDVAAFTDARIAALHAGLKLNADQEKLWPPLESAIRALTKQRQEARAARRERFMTMRDQVERNIPDMLRFMADRQAASADALRKLADASAPLYASLDEAQKRRMMVLARGFVRPGMMGQRHGMNRGGFGPERMRRGALDGQVQDFAADGPASRVR